MRVKIASLLAATALLAACDSAFDTETMTCGQGGVSDCATGAPTPGTAADFVANVGDRVFFDFDRSSLRVDGKETLKKQAEWLNKFSCVTVTIEGHCDERGTSEYNLGLGERRGSAVRKMLTSMGVAPSRIKVVSYGKERPIVPGSGEAAWSQNRVAITVID